MPMSLLLRWESHYTNHPATCHFYSTMYHSSPFITVNTDLSSFLIAAHISICTWMCICTHVCMINSFRHMQVFVTLWTVARQAPQSIGFSRQEYWSGLPCPPPGDLPNRGIKCLSPNLHISSRFSLTYSGFDKKSCLLEEARNQGQPLKAS